MKFVITILLLSSLLSCNTKTIILENGIQIDDRLSGKTILGIDLSENVPTGKEIIKKYGLIRSKTTFLTFNPEQTSWLKYKAGQMSHQEFTMRNRQFFQIDTTKLSMSPEQDLSIDILIGIDSNKNCVIVPDLNNNNLFDDSAIICKSYKTSHGDSLSPAFVTIPDIAYTYNKKKYIKSFNLKFVPRLITSVDSGNRFSQDFILELIYSNTRLTKFGSNHKLYDIFHREIYPKFIQNSSSTAFLIKDHTASGDTMNLALYNHIGDTVYIHNDAFYLKSISIFWQKLKLKKIKQHRQKITEPQI